MRLNGKVAIVTGGAQGIGRAIALSYAREGASVVICDLKEEGAQKVVKEITTRNGRATAVVADVRNRGQVEAMINTALSEFGGLDILVNNAGVCRIVPFLETTEEDWDFMFDINCKALLWCSQAAARVMIEQGRGGKIINIASVAGRHGEPYELVYCASKASVISMTQSMALALAKYKINVNAIAPGVVDTNLWVENDKQFARILDEPIGEPKRRVTSKIPLGRIEQPEDVAGVAVFLASSEADYMTQQCINIDGGNRAN
jgi:D-sorbitol dehydrogenase (acceptor)